LKKRVSGVEGGGGGHKESQGFGSKGDTVRYLRRGWRCTLIKESEKVMEGNRGNSRGGQLLSKPPGGNSTRERQGGKKKDLTNKKGDVSARKRIPMRGIGTAGGVVSKGRTNDEKKRNRNKRPEGMRGGRGYRQAANGSRGRKTIVATTNGEGQRRKPYYAMKGRGRKKGIEHHTLGKVLRETRESPNVEGGNLL